LTAQNDAPRGRAHALALSQRDALIILPAVVLFAGIALSVYSRYELQSGGAGAAHRITIMIEIMLTA